MAVDLRVKNRVMIGLSEPLVHVTVDEETCMYFVLIGYSIDQSIYCNDRTSVVIPTGTEHLVGSTAELPVGRESDPPDQINGYKTERFGIAEFLCKCHVGSCREWK